VRTAIAARIPQCHMSHVSGVAGRLGRPATAVWICQYPYPTMRLQGPSSECDDCPVWQEMQRAGRVTADAPSGCHVLAPRKAS